MPVAVFHSGVDRLHFSAIHLNRYASDPEEYIEKMKGMDKDLAAHFKIIRHRGKTIYGRNVSSVFSEVSDQNYMDSIWSDVEEGINGNPTYVILNLCRVLAYASEKLILSKREGGEWALRRISQLRIQKNHSGRDRRLQRRQGYKDRFSSCGRVCGNHAAGDSRFRIGLFSKHAERRINWTLRNQRGSQTDFGPSG